jgi:proteasome accessory factor B
MGRNDRIARLFRVLEHLVRAKRGVPLKTIADREGWALRSLYRDIEALEKAGVPIRNENGLFSVMEGWTPAAQLGVDAEELLALYVARQQAAGWQGTRVAAALDRLYGKLAAPARGTGTLVPAGLGEGFTAAPLVARDWAATKNHVAVLDHAIAGRHVVTAIYESLDGEVTRRQLEPAQLHWDARLETLYLVAWCRLRDDVRVFAAHRFRKVSPERMAFTPRPELASELALRHAFRVWREARVAHVVLRFVGRGARLVAERRWHPSQKLGKLPGGALRLELDVAGVGELTPWILSFGAECEVLEPATLREAVRDAHAAAAGTAPSVNRSGARSSSS